MDKKHKIITVIGTAVVLAVSVVGGYSIYARKDAITPVTDTGSSVAQQMPAGKENTLKPTGDTVSILPKNLSIGQMPVAPQATPQQTSLTSPAPTTSTTTKPTVTTPTTPAPAAPVTTPTPAPAPTYTYKNGTYTATVTYSVPNGGTNTITTTAVVSNDKVTSIVTTHNANASGKSLNYINPFESSVCSVVCGKSLAGLSPSTIAGASLTTAAFKNTLTSIRSSAKA